MDNETTGTLLTSLKAFTYDQAESILNYFAQNQGLFILLLIGFLGIFSAIIILHFFQIKTANKKHEDVVQSQKDKIEELYSEMNTTQNEAEKKYEDLVNRYIDLQKKYDDKERIVKKGLMDTFVELFQINEVSDLYTIFVTLKNASEKIVNIGGEKIIELLEVVNKQNE